ncbi:MAG: hypothetical protein MUC43_04530 [Pirellula sp.]|jgi:hypothetical protein|nr:hypothetical protein [Pirellula sp.]
MSEIPSRLHNAPSKSNLTQLKVSNIDKAASLLMSCLIIVSTSVCFLGAFFLLSKLYEHESDQTGGGGQQSKLDGSEYVAADSQSEELLLLPESENWKETLSDQALDTIQMVSLIESNASTLSEAFDAKDQNGPKADPRGEGILQDGPGSFAVPSGTRWELRFSATDRKSYAQQLDSLGIELGVYGAGRPVVEYASKLTNNKPSYRRGSPSDERRPYFMSITNGVLKEYDLQLLKLAGIEILGRQPIKFVSRETEDKLVQLEIEHAYAKMGTSFPLERVYRTAFECRPNVNGHGFEMVVVSQRYKSN